MVITSPRLSLFVLVAIPVIVLPLVGFGRAVRRRVARRAGHARRRLGLCRRTDRRVRTLQAFTNEKPGARPLRARRSSAPSRPREASTGARAVLTAIAIFLVFASVVVVLWVGAQDVLAGDITPGRLSQFVLYAVFAASGLGQLSEVWGELSQASGAAERLFEILSVEARDQGAGAAGPAAGARARRGRLRRRALRLSDAAATPSCSTACRSACGRARRSRSSARRAPARARSSI